MKNRKLSILGLIALLSILLCFVSVATAQQTINFQTSPDFQQRTVNGSTTAIKWVPADGSVTPEEGDLIWAIPVVDNGSDSTVTPLKPSPTPSDETLPQSSNILLYVVVCSAVIVIMGSALLLSKRRHQKSASSALVALMLIGVFAALPLSSADQVETTDYYLSTPTGECDYEILNYTDNSYGVVRMSDWANLMTFVGYNGYGGLLTPPWAGYSLNSTAVYEAVYANISYGRIVSKEVAYPIGNAAIVIPDKVEVDVYYQGDTYKFTGANNTAGSPYTVSVGAEMLDGYYLAADSADRFIDSWSSLDAVSVMQNIADVSGSKFNIVLKSGYYPFSTATYIDTTYTTDMYACLNLTGKTSISIIGEDFPIIDGTGSPSNSLTLFTTAFWIMDTANVHISGLQIQNIDVAFCGGGTNIAIENNLIYNTSNSIGIHGSHIYIQHNVVDTTKNNFGIVIGDDSGASLNQKNKVSNNDINILYNNISNTFWAGIEKGYDGNDITIAYNNIVNCGWGRNDNGILIYGSSIATGHDENYAVKIHDNFIKNCPNGITVEPRYGGSDHAKLWNLNIYNNDISDLNATSGIGVSVTGSEALGFTGDFKGVNIYRNNIDWSGYGVYVGGNVTSPLISENRINHTISGIKLSALTTPLVSNPMVSRNIIENSERGIELVNNIYNATIQENTLTKISTIGIELYNIVSPIIKNNRLNIIGSYGIHAASVTKPEIKNNNIESDASTAIYIEVSVTSPIIDSNTIKNSNAGIYIGNNNTAPSVKYNTFQTITASAIRLSALSGTITSPEISYNTISNAQYGIELLNNANNATVKNNKIGYIWRGINTDNVINPTLEGNDITNSTEKGIYVGSTVTTPKIIGGVIEYVYGDQAISVYCDDSLLSSITINHCLLYGVYFPLSNTFNATSIVNCVINNVASSAIRNPPTDTGNIIHNNMLNNIWCVNGTSP